MKTITKINISGYKILTVAMLISLGWHLSWLSMVKIKSSTIPETPIKYSEVAFLGPMLTRVSMNLSASPASRSVLERRYKSIIEKISYDDEEGASKSNDLRYESRLAFRGPEEELLSATTDTVNGDKLEIDYPIE